MSKESEPEKQPPSSEKSLWETIKEPFKQVQDSYRSLDIKGTIEKYREKINHDVIENPTLKKMQQLPHKPKEISAEIDKELRTLSIKFNENYPYAASMCRSHPTLILGSFLTVCIFPLWTRRKYSIVISCCLRIFFRYILNCVHYVANSFKTVAKSAVALTLLGQGTLEVINYQWSHELSKPKDFLDDGKDKNKH